MIYQLTPTGGQYVISPEELRQSGPLVVRPSVEHDLTTRAHAAQSLAEQFLEARRAKHGDLRMEADTDTDTTDDTATDADSADGDDDSSDDGADKLGDPGKQALDRMKGQLKTTKAELRAFKALGLTPEQIQALQKPAADDQPDPDTIRRQVRAEIEAESNRERIVDKIEAKAAKGFADPEDAVAILLRTHDADDFLDGGKVDVEAIQEALNDLLEKKPHLAAAQGGRRFQGGADGGARKETAKPEPTAGMGRLRAAYAD